MEEEAKAKIWGKIELDDDASSSSRLGFDPLTVPPSLGNLNSIEESPERKISALKNLLEKDPVAADVKWSIFVAASHSYKFDSCLKPFPPMYIKNECKDIDALREAIERIPPFVIVLRLLQESDVYQNSATSIDLLYWVLIRMRDPHIKSVNKECVRAFVSCLIHVPPFHKVVTQGANLQARERETTYKYESVLKRVPSEMSVAMPNLIFQVASTKQSPSEERWRTSLQGHSTLYAYHGSRLENFHSIIHYGLQQNMCRNSLYGKGIYLSSELGVSLTYSPVGYGWGGSILGSELSCVALCELVNHPDVKRGDSGDDASNTMTDTMGGKVPNKYYLAINSDLVRIRYLLVYSQEFSSQRDKGGRGLVAWFKRHKLLTFVLGYVVLLASVGLAHNKHVEKYCRLFIQKVGLQ